MVASLGGIRQVLQGTPMRERTAVLRKYMDEIFADRSFDARFVPVDCRRRARPNGCWRPGPTRRGARCTSTAARS